MSVDRLRHFIQSMTRDADRLVGDDDAMVTAARGHLTKLIAEDDWLPGEFAQPHPEHYSAIPSALRSLGQRRRLEPGNIEELHPRKGDIHKVSNAYDDRVSISIHVYGANIGAVRRHVFDPQTGAAKSFVSGYGASVMPNVWDRSR